MTLSKSRKQMIVVVASLFVLLLGFFIYDQWVHIHSDNAQVGGPIVLLSSRISGTVLKVNFDENTSVTKGAVLAEIDPADYQTAFASAEAQVSSIEARLKEAEVNFKRAEDLFRTQAISRERFDNAQATLKDLEAKLKAVQALRDQAKLNLTYTRILAPANGTIAKKSIEVGQNLIPNQAVFGFVDDSIRWVTANLKETQLESIAIGSKADIEIDALSGHKFKGEVESISPSTGAVFTLLPPDNATGNFTKVVQRIAVRIRFLNLKPEEMKQLQVGLSTYVSIRSK